MIRWLEGASGCVHWSEHRRGEVGMPRIFDNIDLSLLPPLQETWYVSHKAVRSGELSGRRIDV